MNECRSRWLQVPATNLKRIFATPTWYVLEQIQSGISTYTLSPDDTAALSDASVIGFASILTTELTLQELVLLNAIALRYNVFQLCR